MHAPGNLDSLRRQFPLWMPALVVLAGIVNFIIVPLPQGTSGPDTALAVVLAALAGVVVAETAVLALWLAFWEWPLPLKLAWHWLAGLFLYGCWAFGLLAAMQSQPAMTSEFQVQVLIASAASLPPISLAVQSPLWIARSLFHWRLLPEDAPAPSDARLSIRDLFALTTVVAASLACLRLAVFTQQELEPAYWASWGAGVLALAAVSAAVLLPLVAIVLRPRRSESALTGTVVFAVLLVAVGEFAILAMMTPYGGGPDIGEVLFVTGTFFVSVLASLAGPLWLIRKSGYRLRFPGDARREELQRGLAGRAAPS